MISDLKQFESAIRATYSKLKNIRLYYTVLLILLVTCEVYGIWWIVIQRDNEMIVEIAGGRIILPIDAASFLGVVSAALVLFFLTGLYSCKIKAPNNYIVRCNAGLQPFNISYDSALGKLVCSEKVE
eukprot:CAMPEP_0174385432 /NCGR_PEP_ID=MMETSP0811_2-20130205/126590_1 /TAXON_ID=73025 ORGANISM="Eutreptiella gymnastica-like, Strain CCMP1594" /NCGR_SAMPLE_ID=MMETSP0811_2 /ASSEMBLY_ACC=CAM_ASM_000667 /LENGTH=126 /DNA_ID=CAMNT_0015539743 /DNA_START=138 /DNA_END=518 /DNA_ORIENTATION=-